jgi:hypothetical protein
LEVPLEERGKIHQLLSQDKWWEALTETVCGMVKSRGSKLLFLREGLLLLFQDSTHFTMKMETVRPFTLLVSYHITT